MLTQAGKVDHGMSCGSQGITAARSEASLNPNVANLLPAKTAKLAPGNAICALTRLRQDLTYG